MTEVMTFYRFVPIHDPGALHRRLCAAAHCTSVKGTILIAPEGINGTLSGREVDLQAFARELLEIEAFAGMAFKTSRADSDNRVFYRLKIKIRDEIVAFGQPGLEPAKCTGQHVDAQRWNQLLADPEVLVVDARNTYEIAIGSFPGAVDPGTRSFREFAGFVRERLDPQLQPKIAMYCTGGIRCEKASAFMLDEGFSEVYQLQGGVLQYLETVASEQDRWKGECFVFDQRVSVDRSLQEGSYQQCFACRRPLSVADRASEYYQPGLSCAYCVDDLNDERVAALHERNRQVGLADSRGQLHIGADQCAGVARSDASRVGLSED